jgi:Carboxypeptidase regulatory-like domain/TonB dependent receptor-like, beta-barrel
MALRAQVLYGSLTGNVTDPSGAPIVGAHVEALNVNTGITKEATTDSSGIYRFVEVLPGTYKVTVSAGNFASAEIENIRVDANSVRRADAQLKVAQVKQSVTVTTEAPLLQTDRSDVHSNLTATEVQNLPAISSEGSSFQALYKIIPGFTPPMESNSAGGNPQRAMTSNVNGQSTQGNDTTIDGVRDSYPWLPANIAYVPPTDAVETVNIETNSFDAEQGDAGGALINVQIKTGTNSFHGDAHELHTDKSLWALNYFNPPTFTKPENIFNQFGGSLGGPIKKNKLFFFADEESTRQIQAPNGNFKTVPTGGLDATTATAQGFFDFRGITDSNGNPVNIYDPRTGNPDGTGRSIITCNGVQNEICLSDVDPAALAMATRIPAANESGTANNYIVTGRGLFHRDDIDSKVDYVLSPKSTLWGRYSFSRSFIFDPPSLGAAEGDASNGGQLGNAFSRIQIVGLGGNYVLSPNLLFDVNSGFTRQRIDAESTDIGTNFGLDTLMIPGTNGTDPLQGGIPAFQFNTFANLGNANTGNPFLFRDNQYVGNANLTWVHGRHQFRFGIEYSHTQLNHFQPQGGSFQTARGSFRFTGVGSELATCAVSGTSEKCSAAAPTNAQFNSYADFLLGLPDEVGKAVQNIDPIALRWSEWAWYARDQWQVTPQLTVNYGLRWEFYPMAYSDVGGARVLDPSTMDVLIGGGNSGIPIDDGVNVGHGLFLPRIGIAYRPFQNTVIRAGYGITADSNNWRFLRNAYPADSISDFVGNTYPQALGSAFAPAASLTGMNAVGPYSYLPIGITPIAISPETPGAYPLPNGIGTTTVAKDFRRGYINDFNLTVEHDFSGWVADVGYVGDRAIRPLENVNINPAPAGGGQAGRILNAQFGGNWSDINQLTPLFNNYYDSLQAKVTRRLHGGSVIGFAYTFSKAIDYEDDEELNFILWPYPAYWPRNKAVAGFDRTHNFEAYGVYNLPFGKGERWATSGIASRIAGGWQLNWVLSAMSGTPFNITDSGTGASALNAPGNTQTVNLTGPVAILDGTPLSSCAASNTSCKYFSTTNIAQVTTPGVLGNAGRDILRGPGLFNLDTSLYRNFKITERFTFQFQADAYGVTNTPHFGNPNSNISGGNFGAVTSTLTVTNASLGGSGGQRQWWFGGKLLF